MFDHIIRQGDRVCMNMNEEARDWGRKGVPNGTLGTVAGRFRATDIIEHRYPRYNREPGVYSTDGVPLIVWDQYPDGVDPMDPDYTRVGATDLNPADSFLDEYNQRYKTEWPVRLSNGQYNIDFDMTATADKLDNRERTGDLPETPFWELDIVEHNGCRYQIRSISYNAWGPERRHCYSMEGVDENNVYDRGGSHTVEPDELTLLERGNVWKEHHGEHLVFHSIEEEARYATAMGRAPEVRNPKDNLYNWTLDEVLDAIRNDIVDGFTNGTMMFSDRRKISAMRFKDRNLGERVRQQTLKGFDLIPA
jgi:hypothetical protein